jgi:hypothetical protein
LPQNFEYLPVNLECPLMHPAWECRIQALGEPFGDLDLVRNLCVLRGCGEESFVKPGEEGDEVGPFCYRVERR